MWGCWKIINFLQQRTPTVLFLTDRVEKFWPGFLQWRTCWGSRAFMRLQFINNEVTEAWDSQGEAWTHTHSLQRLHSLYNYTQLIYRNKMSFIPPRSSPVDSLVENAGKNWEREICITYISSVTKIQWLQSEGYISISHEQSSWGSDSVMQLLKWIFWSPYPDY